MNWKIHAGVAWEAGTESIHAPLALNACCVTGMAVHRRKTCRPLTDFPRSSLQTTAESALGSLFYFHELRLLWSEVHQVFRA